MSTFLKKNSIKPILVTVFIVMLGILCSIIFYVCYHSFFYVNLRNTAEARKALLLQISDTVSHVQSGTQILSNLYYYNDDLDTIIQTNPIYLDEQTIWKHNILMKTMDQLYDNAMINFDMDYYSVFIAQNGYHYTSLKNRNHYDYSKYGSEFWSQKLKGTNGNLIIVSPYLDCIDNTDTWVISFARIVKDANGHPAGILLINVKERSIYDKYADITPNSTICIINDAGTLISATNASSIGTSFSYKNILPTSDNAEPVVASIQGIDNLITTCKVPDTDLQIIEMTPLSQITAPFKIVLNRIIPIIFVICVIAVVLYLWIISRITAPLQSLCKQLEAVGNGDFNICFHNNGCLEVQRINASCEIMLKKISSLFAHLQAEEAEKRTAEMRALQAQINPHFIYNTLFSIKCMVEMQENKSASEMLKLFSNIIKHIFRVQNEFATVHEISLMLNDYCSLMQYRYPNRFSVHFHIPNEVQNYSILRFTLQPLIENALFHGIVPSAKENCEIKITISKIEDLECLLIEISDNGIGMTPEMIEKLLYPDSNPHHIGVFNVSERLKLYFDIPEPLHIQSEFGKGTTIQIRHPLIILKSP